MRDRLVPNTQETSPPCSGFSHCSGCRSEQVVFSIAPTFTQSSEQVADQASIAEGRGGIYTISIDTSDISCTLTNETPSPHESNQKIDVSCTSRFSGSATVTG